MARISKTTNSGYVRLVLEVNETSTNIQANTSTISWQLWLERASTWVFDLNNESLAEVEINGQSTLSKYVSYDLRNSQWVTFGSGTMTIPHNEDGTKSITIWARLTNVADQGNINWFSGTVNLSNIPRSSGIKSVTETELGQPITINIDKKVADFRHQVWWRVNGSDWVDLGKGHDTSVQITVPIEYANRITNSTAGSLDVSVRTFQGDTKIGVDVDKYNVPIKVPENIVPTIAALTSSEQTNELSEVIPQGYFIKDKSVIRLAIDGVSGAYGSTIVSSEVALDNLIVRAAQGDFPANKTGELTATAKITDSRGRTATTSIQVNVLNYYAPKILGFLANRAGNGTNKTIIATVLANVCPVVINGVDKNSYSIKIQYSEKKANRWLDAVSYTDQTIERLSRQIDCGAFYDLTKSYDLKLIVKDKLSKGADSTITVRSSSVLAVMGDGRWAFGGFPELKGHLESFYPVAVHNTLNAEEGLLSRGNPIQEFVLTSRDGKSLKYNGNLNNLRTSGGYHAFGVQNNPLGTNNYGYVNVITHSTDNGYCVQFYVPFNSDQFYMRRCDSNRWSDWIRIVTTGVDTGWKIASLQNGWQHHVDYGEVQYSKTVDGIVHFKGTAKGGKTSKETVILNLPEEYRPKSQLYVFAMNDSFGTAVLGITNDGRVVVKNNVDASWLGFDNVSFKI